MLTNPVRSREFEPYCISPRNSEGPLSKYCPNTIPENPASGFFVMILITPASASLPYSDDIGPFTTSTRSTFPTDTLERSNTPATRPIMG